MLSKRKIEAQLRTIAGPGLLGQFDSLGFLLANSLMEAFPQGGSVGAAEDNLKEDPQEPSRPPPFVEVTCKSSGKKRCFAAGTQAGFALHLINRRRDVGVPPAFLIEAAKEGEEPVSFGPTSVLVDYGEGWRLQTIPEEGYEAQVRKTEVKDSAKFHHKGKSISGSPQKDNFLYVGKILLAFGFIFLIGGIFTLFLENLPGLIMFVNSSS